MTHFWKKFGFIVLVICAIWVCGSASCPALCSCKWKRGKQTVECRNKGLSGIPSEIEHGTQTLDFNGNNLPTLRRHAFLSKGIINLQRLHLSACNIGKIDDDAFDQLSNLVELDLSKNALTAIPSMALRHVPALRDLNLAGNPLSSVPAQSFVYVPALVHLDISNCRLKTVSPLALQPLGLLETLQLQNNKIKELPEPVIISLESSHGVRVHDNPWFCDCRALPLWRLLEVRRVPHPVSPTCNSPHRIAGTQFNALEEKDFACPPEIRPVIGVVEGVAGENATVTCPVEGQPSPDVLWYIGDRPVVNGSILGVGPQRVYIVNGGQRDRVSHLVITGAQEADSGQIRCIAINPAGRATANFTLAVTMKAISSEPLNSGHIAGIAIAMIILVVIILVAAFMALSRRKTPRRPSPAKERSPSLPGSPSEPNPIQKPPRLTDFGSSSSTNPDLISEVEKSSRTNYSNGFLPNFQNGPLVSEIGDYTRMEGESLYPSSLWESQVSAASILHEHYNPGYTHDSPLHIPDHSTPLKISPVPNFDPQIFGYPSDYGLPIPEIEGDSLYGAIENLSPTPRGVPAGDKSHYDIPGDEEFVLNQSIYGSPYITDSCPQNVYSMFSGPEVRIRENKMADKIHLGQMDSRLNVAEGAESLRVSGPPGERPWVPGSQNNQAVPLGVQVLPPLPSAAHRIKTRDSPDEGYQEGYQEGTDV